MRTSPGYKSKKWVLAIVMVATFCMLDLQLAHAQQCASDYSRCIQSCKSRFGTRNNGPNIPFGNCVIACTNNKQSCLRRSRR